ncbi:MAG: STAS domain-containing protein [Acidobacteria bacterium]|nr:STAS domain-containing protein [Acidobacteriota bacterium]MBI3471927.1 STAS domain-containing protein [Candidatus Solibacter usitatus]
MLLSIDQKRIKPGVVVLVLAGKIALGRECQKIEQQVSELIQHDEKKIILDLAGVEYIDSTGVGLIALCAGRTRTAGGNLFVAGARGMVLNILNLTKMDTIVGTYADSVAAASEI